MNSPKITIITPCYNGESHLQPYINGLLSQKYQNVEYIFVDDASVDNTQNIILSYEKEFIKKGWTFKYIKCKERKGQASAINRGLKIFTGDYICCPDSDDVLLPSYLEDMSNFMESHPECVLCYPWAVEAEEHSGKIRRYYKRHVPEHTHDVLFDNLVLGRNKGENAVFYPSYMLRASAFLSVYKDRQIYPGLTGQNAQMTLPFIYNYKTGYVEKILYKVTARKNSDSRLTDYKDRINKSYSWEDVACQTLKYIPNMPDYEKAYYFNFIKQKWAKNRRKWSRPKFKFAELLQSVKKFKVKE